MQCKCDLLELDSSLSNNMRVICFQAKAFRLIPIPGITQTNRLDLIKTSRLTPLVLQRLKSTFITPHKPDGDAYKQANDFHHPCSTIGQLTPTNGHSYQVQIGSKPIPEYPVNSLAESYSQLKKTVGRAFKMHSSWYRSRKYIIGLDLEKISGAGFTGLSTKAGDLLTLNSKDCDADGAPDSVPARVFCALNYDCVLNIQDSSIQLPD